MAKYSLVVFSNPTAGRDDEYNTWYTNTHLKDVVSVPGYTSAQRFKRQALMIGDLKHEYLAIYDMDANTPAEAEAAVQALVTTDMELSSALDADGVVGGVYEACSPTVTSASGKQAGSFRMLALSEPVDGREDEFNKWYNGVHLPEVTAVAGFPFAQRLKLATPLGDNQLPTRYIALYGMEANDMATAGGDVQRLAGSGLQQSDSSRGELTTMAIYEVISEKVTAPAKELAAG